MKKTIKDFNLIGKKVIIRVDFNVPIKNNEISDDNRIIESLETIKYAINNNAKVILMSHLGRVKTDEDKINNSLKIVGERLSELLNKDVIFIDETRGKKLELAIDNLKNGDVLLMENTRFEDIDGKLESNCDETLGRYWASLGDIFINDAFGTSHRSHASNVGIASNLENGIGFLIEKELENFKILDMPKRPYTLILGGAKVSDKIGVIDSLVKKCDNILIGGGMAYTFLNSLGYNVGLSLIDNESIDYCKNLLNLYKEKIILPVDSVTSKRIDDKIFIKENNVFENDDIGLDIGPKTIEKFKEILKESNTIVWNGPLGYFEIDKYSNGTKEILEFISNSNKVVIIGGGDTASAAINFGYKNSFTHISTGGGASLELLEGKNLPGIDIINEK